MRTTRTNVQDKVQFKAQLGLVPLSSPAPPDIWTRLARLNTVCAVSINSLWRTSLAGRSPGWRITIKRRARPLDDGEIVIIRTRAVDAIVQGLDEAGARNWHLPEAAPGWPRYEGVSADTHEPMRRSA